VVPPSSSPQDASADLSVGRHPRPFPERVHRHGPATRRRLARAATFYLVVCLVGLIPIIARLSDRWRALGLGLLAPGAGFLYPDQLISIVYAVMTVAAFYVAFVVWFATGNVLAPIGVWLGAAALATVPGPRGGRWWMYRFVAGIIGAFAAWRYIVGTRELQKGPALRREFNERLATIDLPEGPIFGSQPIGVGPELTEDDLAVERWFLNLALQPIDRFDGFSYVDQYQFAAIRYQLNYLQYALAMAQYTRTPAFHGYLSEAQRNLIDKMTIRSVWSYWRLENMWGNLRYAVDPIVRDNIMFSGYLGYMLGLYESTTGDQRYDAPGALSFRWSGHEAFEHDHGSIHEALAENFSRSPFTYFPCEPNWIYNDCNQMGMVSLKVHDRLHGTNDFASLSDRLERAYEEEFTRPDRQPVLVRSGGLGCEIDFPGPFAGATKPARRAKGHPPSYSWRVAAIFPEFGERAYFLRSTATRDAIMAGSLDPREISRFDPGFYRNTGTGVLPNLAAAAREIGDDDLCNTLRQMADAYLDPVVEGGAKYYRAMSPLAMGLMFHGVFSRKNGFFDLVNRGNPEEWNAGPVLEEAPYPDVLVARAVTDGDALHLVLRPGGSDTGRVGIRLGRLIPGRGYVVSGAAPADFIAGIDGRAELTLDLPGRIVVQVAPAP
jgi:Linalool dehydratase/isomerase